MNGFLGSLPFFIGVLLAAWWFAVVGSHIWRKAKRDYNDPESEFNQQKRYAWHREELYRQRDLDGGGQRQRRQER